MELPVNYNHLHTRARQMVRQQYIDDQHGICIHCSNPLDGIPPATVTGKKIKWSLFPRYFMKHPIHLQHNHKTGMTEGAIHAYCNAVLWQYHKR